MAYACPYQHAHVTTSRLVEGVQPSGAVSRDCDLHAMLAQPTSFGHSLGRVKNDIQTLNMTMMTAMQACVLVIKPVSLDSCWALNALMLHV